VARPRRKATILTLLLAGVAALGSVPPSAGAATTIVVEPAPGEDEYAPPRVVRPLAAASFRWLWGPEGAGTASPHDVEQNAGLFDSGTAVTSGEFVVAASAGGFPYFCSIHFGMVGRLDVRPEGGEAYPRPFRVRWATPASETGRSFEVRYRAGAGAWRTWFRDTERGLAVFGRDRRPARVREGVAYRLQVRALRTRLKRSDWSPSLLVGPSARTSSKRQQ
jgi:hypothetical protein